MESHTNGVATHAKAFAAKFSSADWAHNAAWLHYLGKLDSAFQGYLLRENGLDDGDYDTGRVNHSSAGAACAVENLGPCVGQILAHLIAGHHAGLPDWDSADTGNAALSVRKTEGEVNYARIRSEALEFGPKSRWKRSGRRTGYAARKSASARKEGAFDEFVKVSTADAKSEKPAGAIWSAQHSLRRVRKRSPVEQVAGEALEELHIALAAH